jgi:hypothetical protein
MPSPLILRMFTLGKVCITACHPRIRMCTCVHDLIRRPGQNLVRSNIRPNSPRYSLIYSFNTFPQFSMESSPALPSTQPSPPLAALSIYQIARLNCREKLLVDPLYWTSRHISLLQCHFDNPVPAPSSQDSQSQSQVDSTDRQLSQKVVDHVKRLRSRGQPFRQDIGICGILTDPGCPFTYQSVSRLL